MAILTAQQLKDRETPEFPIPIGGGDEVWARMPDIQLLILQGILPSPLLNGVIKMIGAWAGTPVTELTEEIIKESPDLLRFVDIMANAALVKPRVVLRFEDQVAPDMLLASDLTVATKKAILVAVCSRMASPAVVAAATEFPRERPGEGVGPDVPEIPAAAV